MVSGDLKTAQIFIEILYQNRIVLYAVFDKLDIAVFSTPITKKLLAQYKVW